MQAIVSGEAYARCEPGTHSSCDGSRRRREKNRHQDQEHIRCLNHFDLSSAELYVLRCDTSSTLVVQGKHQHPSRLTRIQLRSTCFRPRATRVTARHLANRHRDRTALRLDHCLPVKTVPFNCSLHRSTFRVMPSVTHLRDYVKREAADLIVPKAEELLQLIQHLQSLREQVLAHRKVISDERARLISQEVKASGPTISTSTASHRGSATPAYGHLDKPETPTTLHSASPKAANGAQAGTQKVLPKIKLKRDTERRESETPGPPSKLGGSPEAAGGGEPSNQHPRAGSNHNKTLSKRKRGKDSDEDASESDLGGPSRPFSGFKLRQSPALTGFHKVSSVPH